MADQLALISSAACQRILTTDITIIIRVVTAALACLFAVFEWTAGCAGCSHESGLTLDGRSSVSVAY